MNTVTYYHNVNMFQTDRKPNYKNLFKFETDKVGEAAAELAFHLTNAPFEYLEEAEQALVAGFRGPSMSVGDIAVVITGNGDRPVERFICEGSGWKFVESF